MERLTKHWGNNYVATKLDYCSLLEIPDEDFKCFEAIVKKLAEYEDLEEQGRLIKLPCKVGDTVYRFWYVDYIPYKVQPVKIRTLSNLIAMMEGDEFGKTIFLTKEEAEKALEMEK